MCHVTKNRTDFSIYNHGMGHESLVAGGTPQAATGSTPYYRAQTLLSLLETQPIMKLILVRHGESASNRRDMVRALYVARGEKTYVRTAALLAAPTIS
jgi:hypothetical protein